MIFRISSSGSFRSSVASFAEWMLQLGLYPPREVNLYIARETCRGLEFAHGRRIVHRDLKPGNVWLSSDGTAKAGDFGLAVALDRSHLTTEGMMVSTQQMPVHPTSSPFIVGHLRHMVECVSAKNCVLPETFFASVKFKSIFKDSASSDEYVYVDCGRGWSSPTAGALSTVT